MHFAWYWLYVALVLLYALSLIVGLVVTPPAWFTRRRCRNGGTPRDGGSEKLSVSTGTKEHGTRTPETGTSAECSSFSPPGAASMGLATRIALRLASSYTVRGSSTDVMAALGGNGEPLGSAD